MFIASSAALPFAFYTLHSSVGCVDEERCLSTIARIHYDTRTVIESTAPYHTTFIVNEIWSKMLLTLFIYILYTLFMMPSASFIVRHGVL